MKVAKLTAPRRIEVEDVELSLTPAAGEAVVRVKSVGICGTDIHIFKGERSDVRLPRVMGHELSGVVTAVGCGVENIAVGSRVVFDPVMACGECAVCQKGFPNVCSNVKCYGVQMDGGFRGEICVSAKQLYEIPNNVSFNQAALAEPFSIAANILDRAGLKAGEKLLVAGAGTIGLCLIQAAKGLGAAVIAADVVEEKLEVAKRLGCDATVNLNARELEKAVYEWATDGPDVLIDAVGVTPMIEKLVAMAPPASRIMVISFDSRPASIPPVVITKKEISILGSRMNAGKFPRVIDWLKNSQIDPDKLISRVYPIDGIQQAFEAACEEKGLLKIIISFAD